MLQCPHLLILEARCLPSGHVFHSDRSLSVQRVRPGRPELTAPMPRFQVFVDHLSLGGSRAVQRLLVVPRSRAGREPDVWSQRPLCSVVRSRGVFVPVLVPGGRARSLRSVVAPPSLHVRWAVHGVDVGLVVGEGAGLVSGAMVEAAAWEGWRSVAADQRRLWVLTRRIAGKLLTRGAVVRRERVFRVAVLRAAAMATQRRRRGRS